MSVFDKIFNPINLVAPWFTLGKEAIGAGVGLAERLAGGPGAPEAPLSVPTPENVDVASEVEDARKRRGRAANILGGSPRPLDQSTAGVASISRKTLLGR